MQKKPKLVEGNFNTALLLFFFAALDDFSVPQRNTKVIRNLDFWHPIRQLLFVVFYYSNQTGITRYSYFMI